MTDRDQDGSWGPPRSGGEPAVQPAVTGWNGGDPFENAASATRPTTETAARRSVQYWLLGRLFLEEPAEQMLGELALAMRTEELASSERPGALATLQSSIRTCLISPQELASLQAEFARLLYRPVLPTSQHEQRAFELTPPDHLGTELRLMSHLCHLEGEAWRAGHGQEARSLQEQEVRVLEEHLLPWLPGLCHQFAGLARHPFYRTMPALVAIACSRDREALARRIHTDRWRMRRT